ncbi:MAG: PASTA domain-containing protein [Gemmatimonadaceae bacterium]
MNFRALLRRAFPYIVIGVGGFALAYVVIFIFVLPAKIVPSPPQPTIPTTMTTLAPIDTGLAPVITPPIEPAHVTAAIAEAPAADTIPILVPNLVGMSLPDARGVLNGLRLRAAVSRDTSSFQPPNTVIRQSPLPDSLIVIGNTVLLTASYFPRVGTADTMRVGDSVPLPIVGQVIGHQAPTDSIAIPDTLEHP